MVQKEKGLDRVIEEIEIPSYVRPFVDKAVDYFMELMLGNAKHLGYETAPLVITQFPGCYGWITSYHGDKYSIYTVFWVDIRAKLMHRRRDIHKRGWETVELIRKEDKKL